MKSFFLPKFARTKNLPILFLIIMMILTALSCKQSPILYNISTENPPKDAKIPGSPSKIVAITDASADPGLKDRLYVTTVNNIWSYNGTIWNKMASQPNSSGDFTDIAATNDALFVQTAHSSYELWKTIDGTNWTEISHNFELQGIYAANGELFAAGSSTDGEGNRDYSILWYDGNGLVPLKTGNRRLIGAVHANGYYYLATLNGIYTLTTPAPGALNSASPLSGSTGKGAVQGIIADNAASPNILAVTDDGVIMTAAADGSNNFSYPHNNDNNPFSGALNIAETGSGNFVLMLGYERGDYNYGYREVRLGTEGSFAGNAFGLNLPGSFPFSTITYGEGSEAEYESSLGRVIVTSIIQSPLADKTLFASTSGEGLWSYRDGEWNAEE
jgi:hypothetical protein